MGYAHLSQDERYQIQCLNDGGFTAHEIAEQLNRAASTISRELKRNAGQVRVYRSRSAHRESTLRRHVASSQPHIDAARWQAVEARLLEDWSPEQISAEADISHERIYQHVAGDRRRGGTLWQHLRRRKRRRRHRCGTPRERQRFRGKRIATRPAVVAQRKRVGDWEGDTVVGQGRARIVTLVERKSGYTRLRRVAEGTAATVARAVIHTLYPLGRRVHTVTWDNGSEFAEHELIDIAVGTRSYFADPYSSWQRGCNENLNGLLRQYLPKGSDLGKITDTELQAIEDKLNNRPRKRLGFRTPQQVFETSFNRGALRN
jgi:IS30 family transposase